MSVVLHFSCTAFTARALALAGTNCAGGSENFKYACLLNQIVHTPSLEASRKQAR